MMAIVFHIEVNSEISEYTRKQSTTMNSLGDYTGITHQMCDAIKTP